MQVGGGAGWGECWFDLLCIHPSGLVTPGPKDKNDGNHRNYSNEGSQSRLSGLVSPGPHIAKNHKNCKNEIFGGLRPNGCQREVQRALHSLRCAPTALNVAEIASLASY